MDKMLIAHFATAALACLLVYAAIRDMQTYKIRNQLVLVVALMAPLFWYGAGLAFWPDVALRIAIAAGVFAFCMILFAVGQMGGGDVKLAAALSLWFSATGVLLFLIVMSLAGAAVTLVAVLHHKHVKNSGKIKVPYGVAIAIGGLWLLAQRFLNHFAG